jgi:transcriptional regulator with PAS, ATPase and Fis domain
LPISLQPKLLTFLETKKFRQVGSTKEISVNTRIITATNKDLVKAISEKEFREDLYYRINVVSLQIPSLKDRREDIINIAENFTNLFSMEMHKTICTLTEDAKEKLVNYNWPGNIRELKNIIERAIIFNEDGLVKSEDLIIGESGKNIKVEPNINIPQNGVSLEEIEKKYLKTALQKANGNQTKAAKLLGLTLDTFRYRIKKLN